MNKPKVVLLCPGQGAQVVGMGKGWMKRGWKVKQESNGGEDKHRKTQRDEGREWGSNG